MRHGVITVSPDESVTSVMNLMTRYRVRHIPVVRDGQLAGIVRAMILVASGAVTCCVMSHGKPNTPTPTRHRT
jgi:predicted transcriptional regulator